MKKILLKLNILNKNLVSHFFSISLFVKKWKGAFTFNYPTLRSRDSNSFKYYFVNFFLITLVILIYYCLFLTINYADLIKIFVSTCIFYKLFDYKNITISSLFKLLYNKKIIVILCAVIGFLILYLFDIDNKNKFEKFIADGSTSTLDKEDGQLLSLASSLLLKQEEVAKAREQQEFINAISSTNKNTLSSPDQSEDIVTSSDKRSPSPDGDISPDMSFIESPFEESESIIPILTILQNLVKLDVIELLFIILIIIIICNKYLYVINKKIINKILLNIPRKYIPLPLHDKIESFINNINKAGEYSTKFYNIMLIIVLIILLSVKLLHLYFSIEVYSNIDEYIFVYNHIKKGGLPILAIYTKAKR